MYVIGDATKILMRGLLLCVLHGAVAVGMDDAHRSLDSLLKSMDKISLKQAAKQELQDYFLGAGGADRWFNCDENSMCIVPVAQSLINEHMNIHHYINPSTEKVTTDYPGTRHGNCVYTAMSDNELFFGYPNGAMFIKDRNMNTFMKLSCVMSSKPLSACAFGGPDFIGSDQDKRSILIGYPDKSLAFIDRQRHECTSFHEGHHYPITSITVGHLPDMWIIGGGFAVTILRLKVKEQSNAELCRQFFSFGLSREIQRIGLYKCGIATLTTDGSGLLMPYSLKDYTKIDECSFSEKQITCISRIIAAKKAGMIVEVTDSEKPHFKKLSLVMQRMLLKSSE